MDNEDILEDEEFIPAKSRYSYRKKQKRKHLKKRISYFDYGYKGSLGYYVKELHHIKYPKNSNRQRFLKQKASKATRDYDDIIPKGNFYKKLFDYALNID